MQFSTIYNNIAHRSSDTSSTGIIRAKEAVNDAYQDIVSYFPFSWLKERSSPSTLSLSTSQYSYNIASGISRVTNIWYENSDSSYVYNIEIKYTVEGYNDVAVLDSNSPGIPNYVFIDYKNNVILLDTYPSQSFIDTYSNIKYVGTVDITELSDDTDIPIIPNRFHRKLQDLGTLYRKLDKGDIGDDVFERRRTNIMADLIDEENRNNSGNILLENPNGVKDFYDYGRVRT